MIAAGSTVADARRRNDARGDPAVRRGGAGDGRAARRSTRSGAAAARQHRTRLATGAREDRLRLDVDRATASSSRGRPECRVRHVPRNGQSRRQTLGARTRGRSEANVLRSGMTPSAEAAALRSDGLRALVPTASLVATEYELGDWDAADLRRADAFIAEVECRLAALPRRRRACYHRARALVTASPGATAEGAIARLPISHSSWLGGPTDPQAAVSRRCAGQRTSSSSSASDEQRRCRAGRGVPRGIATRRRNRLFADRLPPHAAPGR